MTGAELYSLLKYKEPVRYEINSMPGVTLYARCVVGVIYTLDRFGRMFVSAELKDDNGCLVRVAAKNVHCLNIKERLERRRRKEGGGHGV